MRLAQIAFHDLPQVYCERYPYDTFVLSINDLGLHHQFLARGVTTVEDALIKGEAYLLASHMHQNRVASRQVDMEPAAAPTAPNVKTPAVANVTQVTVASKVAQMTDMLAKLVSTLAPPNQVDNAREPSGPPAQSPGTGQPFCWECGRPGHIQKNCPPTTTGFKLLRSADAPTPCGPPVGFQGRTKWRSPLWIPASSITERQPTRQVSSSGHSICAAPQQI